MKRLFTNLLVFASPFIILWGITTVFYNESGGDLSRLGKINIDKNYRTQFDADFNQTQLYKNISTLNLNETNTFNILTIGDSFSQQGAHGYQNHIDNSTDVLNFDIQSYKLPTNNPIDLAYKLCNGDVFNKLKINYLLLQSVERSIITRNNELELHSAYAINKINSFKKAEQQKKTSSIHIQFSDYLKFPVHTILYHFADNAIFSPVYQKEISKSLFSANNNLLFLKDDLTALKHNNNIKNSKLLNKNLNRLASKLKEKNITLIVVPSPDKYAIYYDYINTKSNPKPVFFDHLRALEKEYTYIDSKRILKKHIDNGVKDVYFVDDTHWSPIGARIIANSISEIIKNH